MVWSFSVRVRSKRGTGSDFFKSNSYSTKDNNNNNNNNIFLKTNKEAESIFRLAE